MKNTRQMHPTAVRLAGGLIVCGLVGLLAQGGCAQSEPVEFVLEPDGGSQAVTSTGGSTDPGTGGQTGTGGNFGTGGDQATGGHLGTGGITGTGGSLATGGSNGTGGAKATGGSNGTGGIGGGGGMRVIGGTGGNRATGGTMGTGGTVGTGGAGGAGGAPTFTEVYQMILSVSCAGSQCHNPGSQSGVSFSSQSNAYNSVKNRVSAGKATSSSLYTLVNNGTMPPGNKLPAAMISLIAAWINAGALNN